MKKLNIINKDPLILIIFNSLLKLPTPYSISFLWNMGFLLGMTLLLQIVTGLVLSMNYVASVDLAFYSVIHISRDIEWGWLMRYLHMNGASLFFLLLYSHMFRGVYFNSPVKMPMVWISGLTIFLLTMGVAFMGYVLPWGQMSFWGASVITSMLTAIPYVGKDLTQWLWGNFSISQPTLNRFFSIHFLGPFIILGLVISHLIFLHKTGSSNPLGVNSNFDKLKFFSYFFVKDTLPLCMILLTVMFVVSWHPNMLGDVENFNLASVTTTPAHIQPEWYFLFAYAILRSIPSKLGGVIAMLGSILILAVLCIKGSFLVKKFSPFKKFVFWCYFSIMLLLTWIGSNPVEPPFVLIGQFLTAVYFLSFMLL